MQNATPNKKMKKTSSTSKPYTKRAKFQFRANPLDAQDILTKASVYTKGNVSEFCLQAAKAYRPLKRGEGRKA